MGLYSPIVPRINLDNNEDKLKLTSPGPLTGSLASVGLTFSSLTNARSCSERTPTVSLMKTNILSLEVTASANVGQDPVCLYLTLIVTLVEWAGKAEARPLFRVGHKIYQYRNGEQYQ